MRKALIVGIDHYRHANRLFGCVNDARAMNSVIAVNGTGERNFSVKLLTSTSANRGVSRAVLRDQIIELFRGHETETALFYFAGHGHLEATGGYLLASDCRTGDEGIPLVEIVDMANLSAIRNKLIVLDSCHSGFAGSRPTAPRSSDMTEGLTILAASTAEQYANEENGSGIFTGLFVDALNGAAANLVGDVTPGSVYAHIDQSLGPWEQRPVFKTHVKSFISMRKVSPQLAPEDLRKIVELFPAPDFEFRLSPSYEPESRNPRRENTEKFAILQKYNRVNVVIPVGAPHMYHAAMRSKGCRLTSLGQHYWRLVERERI